MACYGTVAAQVQEIERPNFRWLERSWINGWLICWSFQSAGVHVWENWFCIIGQKIHICFLPFWRCSKFLVKIRSSLEPYVSVEVKRFVVPQVQIFHIGGALNKKQGPMYYQYLLKNDKINPNVHTLPQTNISQVGKRKIIFKRALVVEKLVSRREIPNWNIFLILILSGVLFVVGHSEVS